MKSLPATEGFLCGSFWARHFFQKSLLRGFGRGKKTFKTSQSTQWLQLWLALASLIGGGGGGV